MRKIYRVLEQLRVADKVGVLILGESGTGKELVAKAIHEDSPRKRDAHEKYSEFSFISRNCAAFSRDSNTARSELFGHKKGAYTDSTEDRDGVFKLADNGTVFLDEIGRMPIDVQAMLLRYMNDGGYERLGDNKKYHSNVRIICATNEDLDSMVEKGEFRRDLLARIANWKIKLPSLRERKSDLPELANFFIKDSDFLKELFMNSKINFQFDNKAIEMLMTFDFDETNIRQLKSTIGNAMVISKSEKSISNNIYIITEMHLKEGFENAGGQNHSEVDLIQTNNQSDAENLLNQIEEIIVTYELYDRESIAQKIKYFKRGVDKTAIAPETLSKKINQDYKDAIKHLFSIYPQKWINARTKFMPLEKLDSETKR